MGGGATPTRLLTRTSVPVAQRTRRSGGFAPSPASSQQSAKSAPGKAPCAELCSARPRGSASRLAGHSVAGGSFAPHSLPPVQSADHHGEALIAPFGAIPAASSSQAPYPSPLRERRGSLIPLLLLFPTKSTDFVGAPFSSGGQHSLRECWGFAPFSASPKVSQKQPLSRLYLHMLTRTSPF